MRFYLALAKWCLDPESNQGHEDFQSSALPTELSRHIIVLKKEEMVPTAGIELATY